MTPIALFETAVLYFSAKLIDPRLITATLPLTSISVQSEPAPNPGTPAPQLGNLAGTDTSVYVKDLMNLPKNLNEFINHVLFNDRLSFLESNFNYYKSNLMYNNYNDNINFIIV